MLFYSQLLERPEEAQRGEHRENCSDLKHRQTPTRLGYVKLGWVKIKTQPHIKQILSNNKILKTSLNLLRSREDERVCVRAGRGGGGGGASFLVPAGMGPEGRLGRLMGPNILQGE